MGCQNSTASHPRPIENKPTQGYGDNSSSMFYQMQNAKRPKFLNPQLLSQPQKDTLWRIIQSNSLKEFAYYVEAERIPSNMEVGPANTFWNFAHFCCRWDAFQCLYYIIKRIYSEKSTLILSLMNQQSIEGYTALHVAIEWNAINCFYMLLDCGGVDMSYTDKSNNDVFAKANLFKRGEMLEVLERFKSANALMVLVQTENVRGFKEYAQNVSMGQIQARKEYRLTNERIADIIDTVNRLNRPPPPFVPPVKNQANFQQYNNKIKQLESQKNGQTESQEQEESINMKKIEQQHKFQLQQKRINNQRAEQLKRSIEAQRQEELKRLKSMQENQINEQRVLEQTQLAKIQRENELMKQNIEAMKSSPLQSQANYTSTKNKMTCPQDIRPMYEAALAMKTKFVDSQFPAKESSLGNVKDFRFGWQDCVWLRPEQIFPNGQFEVFDGIEPQDIKQGALSVCYYLALISSIAENQQRIKKIFRFYDKQLGFYAIQLYLEGKPITMIVDDQIPCMRGTNQPLFAKPRNAQSWVMIFQKAWVKMFGSYLASQLMASNQMFQNVLPAPCRYNIIDVSKIQSMFDQLVQDDKKNYIMTTTSRGKGQQLPPGIVGEHAYSLIGAYNVNGQKLCKIRNPWGKTQYSGMYSQSSTLWTPQLKQAVGFQPGDDGTFYLNPTQLNTLMPIVTTSYYRDSYKYSYIEINSRSDQELYYVVNLKQHSQIAIKVTQQNQRFKKNMEFQNAPIRLQVWKLEANYDAKVVSQGEPSCMWEGIFALYSTQNMFQSLEAGRYLIRLKVLYDRVHQVKTRGSLRKYIRGTNGKDLNIVRQGKCVLSIYGPDSYVFNKLTTEQAHKYMRNAYRNFLLQSPETSQRLRSVGQDLVPTVIAKDCKMRNQLIYIAQNHLPSHSINFKFKFSYQKFRNCSYLYNVNKETQACEWLIEPGGWNICILQVDCPFQELATDGQMQSSFKIVR